jgi:glucose/arabinose dehydrogenase
MTRRTIVNSLAVALVAWSTSAAAQQTVPMRNGTPVAPSGIPAVALPDKPVEYDTAEGMKIRVVVFTRGLSHPWSLAFLPDGRMLVTERSGKLRIVNKDGTLDPQPVAGLPAVRAQGLNGLMEVSLHPQFATNGFVYFTYTKLAGDGNAAAPAAAPAAAAAGARQGGEAAAPRTVLALARGRWTGSALADVRDIFIASPDAGGPARLTWGRDGTIYMTTGGVNGNVAQDPNSDAGKVLRLRDDGSVPPDNPFVGKAGYRPEIYTLGHRSALGLATRPATGEIWENENGPNGGDEINVLKPGANYGWPLVSYGRTYPGPKQSEHPSDPRFEDPFVVWVPSIAVSGMAFYTGDRLPKWKGDVFVGGLRQGEVPGTGHLERILFNEKMEELRREQLLVPMRQRIRDVRQGPDGLLYLLTDENDAAVLRIEPAASSATN